MLRVILVVMAVFCLVRPAFSQNVFDYATTGPAAPWVIVNDVPDAPFDMADGSYVNYLLVDQQHRAERSVDKHYRHFAWELHSADAVEEYSTITINFDPTYQRVEIHALQLRRGETVIDLLDLADFDIFREETEREKLIYNGRLQMAYVVPGVRVGDVLEHAFTVSGRNPASEPHFFGGFQHQYTVPVQKLYQRFSHAEGMQVTIKNIGDPRPPAKGSSQGFSTYTWDQTDVAGKDLDADVPFGLEALPFTEFSSFKDWAEVGAYFHPLYDPSQFQNDEVLKVAATIRASTSDKNQQLRAALDYVQQEIRYLGIELGTGGYTPRSPELVLERRFGDCKDMVVLLISILKALDIDASPLLVDFDYGAQVVERVPTHVAFDHVVAMVELDGDTYFLDPTRGPQLGDLHNLQQADFGKGVVIAADGPGMIDAVAPKPVWQRDVVDQYDLTDPDVAKFKTTVVLSMGSADYMLSDLERNGLAEIDEGYFKFYQRRYPTLERDEPLKVEIEDDAGKVTITASYLIPDYWQRDDNTGEETFNFSADEILSALPSVDRTDREAPYQLSYPTSIRQKLVLIADENFGRDNVSEASSAPGLSFGNNMFLSGGRYEHTFSYRITEPYIAAQDVAQHMLLLETIHDEIWRSYTKSSTAIWATHPEELSLGYILFALLVSWLVVYLQHNKDKDDLQHQIFYPVRTFKFVLLSILTIGFYQLFWVYKNWVWIRDVQGERIQPFWRTFFLVFTNFSLFSRIAKEDPAAPSIITTLAPIYATIYLIGSYADRMEPTTSEGFMIAGTLSLAGILVMIPVSREVLRKNAPNGKYVSKNSRFGWPTIGLIILYSPILFLYVIGMTPID